MKYRFDGSNSHGGPSQYESPYPNRTYLPKHYAEPEQLTLWPTTDTGNERNTLSAVFADEAEDAEKWRAVAQVWTDCERMRDGYDDVCDALFAIVESIIKGEEASGGSE